MIIPTKLKINNFVYIKNSKVLFPKPDLYFVTGSVAHRKTADASNSSGKSTLCSSIYFALTGNDVGKGVNPKSFVGRFAENVSTTLWLLDTEEGTKYQIDRSNNGKRSKVSFTVDGEPCNAKNLEGTNELIAKNLGIDFDILPYSTYNCPFFSAGEFLYTTDGERRRIITKLYQKQFVTDVTKRIKAVNTALRESVSKLNNEIDLYESKLKDARATAIDLLDTISKTKEYNASLEKNFDKIKKENIRSIRTKLDGNIKKIQEVEKLKDSNEATRKLVGQKANDLQRKYIESEKKVATIESQISETQKRFKKIKSSISFKGECPTCGQELMKEAMEKLIAFRKSLKKSFLKLHSLLPELKERKEKLYKLLHKSNKDFAELARQFNTYGSEIKSLREKNTQLSNEIKQWEYKTPEKKDIKDLEALHYKQTVLADKHKKSMLEKEEERSQLKDKLNKYEFWDIAYSKEIPTMLFESVADQFSEEVGNVIEEIYSDSLQIRFDVDISSSGTQDKFSIMAKDSDMDTWKNAIKCSSGQRKAITFAIQQAISNISGSKLGLQLYDEALDNLDHPARESVLRLLRKRSKTNVLLVVSHDPKLLENQERVIRAVRQRGYIEVANV